MKKTPDSGKQALLLSTVMAIALVFLTAVLARGAVLQLRGGHVLSGVVSIVGALLFCGVSALIIRDLCGHFKPKKQQEDPNG